MDRIAEIQVRRVDKPLHFRIPDKISVDLGDFCIMEFTQGTQDYGRITKFVDHRTFFKTTISGKVLRKFTTEDAAVVNENQNKKKEAFDICREKIAHYKLDMKLIEADYSFDKTKITFYYWANGRIDFRKLVKDIASIFTCRIEMRQIGLRDEAKIKGGCGICGRPLCCALFLKKFQPITMRMVKNQKLPMDMGKISGLCGRLLCCLGYEECFYREKKAKK